MVRQTCYRDSMGPLRFIISQKSHITNFRYILSRSSFYSWRNWDSVKWHKLPKATQPEGPGQGLFDIKSDCVSEMQEHSFLVWTPVGPLRARSPVSPVGPFLLYKWSYLYSEINPVMGVSVPCLTGTARSWRANTDIVLEIWLLMWVEARQNSGSVSEMTQALHGFLVITVSAPVSPTSPQTLFCPAVSHDWVANVKACRAACPSPEGDSSQDRQGYSGKTNTPNSQWLNSQSFSLFLSLSRYISSKGQRGNPAHQSD